MRRTRLNPGEGVQAQYGYGPKLSRRGIDMVYSQASQGIGNTPLQAGGCGGPYGTPGNMQAGGLKFKDVVSGVKKGVEWVKKNKPLAKAISFADSVLPDEVKSNPTYSKVRTVAGKVSSQLGIGQTGTLMGPITFQKGMMQPLTARPRRRTKQAGTGRKRKQAGAGRKRKSKK